MRDVAITRAYVALAATYHFMRIGDIQMDKKAIAFVPFAIDAKEKVAAIKGNYAAAIKNISRSLWTKKVPIDYSSALGVDVDVEYSGLRKFLDPSFVGIQYSVGDVLDIDVCLQALANDAESLFADDKAEYTAAVIGFFRSASARKHTVVWC